MSVTAAKSPQAAATYLAKLIDFLAPQVIVTERLDGMRHKGAVARELVATMADVAANHDVLDVTVKRESRFPDRYAEAAALSELHPVISPWTPKKPRFFDNEPRNTVLFEALALAEVVLDRRPN